MAIEYRKERTPFGVDRYDAKIGPFYVGAQDNGEGWWNWWVALAEQGPAAGDRAIYESGGSESWEKARICIELVMTDVATLITTAVRQAESRA